jgi:ketosteroid isomerase-like protein
MHPNTELLTGFYRAFAARDGEAMATAYAADATFSDPVFVLLKGAEIGAMWTMLCSRAKDLRVEATHIGANETAGRAHWEAWYPFTKTGRQVHNVIDAEFEFRDGKIVRHVDTFDFWNWAAMALGPPGKLLGWTPMLRNAVRSEAFHSLEKFMSAAQRAQ